MFEQFKQNLKTKQGRAIILQNTNIILLWLFLANAIFFPADPFELKILSFALLLVLNLKTIFKINNRFDAAIIVFGFIIPTFAIFMSIVSTRNVMDNVRQGYVGYILLLLPVIKSVKFDYVKIFNVITVLLAVITIYFGICHILGIVSLYDNPLYDLFVNTDCAMIGVAESLLGIIVFMKTSPIFVICMAHSFYKRKVGLAVLYFVALIFSGTRANLLIAVAVFVVGLILIQSKETRKQSLIILAGALIVFMLDGRILDKLISVFENKAGGDAIRSGTLNSIFEGWAYNPLSIIAGTGFSSPFYNTGLGDLSVIVELSYWNLLRQVGIFNFLMIMISFIYPVAVIIKNILMGTEDATKIIEVIGFLGYLIIAYTNPLLYSSTGYVALLFMYMCAKNNNGALKQE